MSTSSSAILALHTPFKAGSSALLLFLHMYLLLPVNFNLLPDLPAFRSLVALPRSQFAVEQTFYPGGGLSSFAHLASFLQGLPTLEQGTKRPCMTLTS